jgi:ATP-binding cassette, subfamily G (WHITE), member 2, PDR
MDLLEMREYADAVIGVPGEGLNVLQRKKLTVCTYYFSSDILDWR